MTDGPSWAADAALMSKRTRHADNSKRQQPIQQQRAQARQPASSGPAKNANPNANPQPGRERKAANDAKR